MVLWKNKTLLAVGACAGVAVALYYALQKFSIFFNKDNELDSGIKTSVSGQSCIMEHSLDAVDTQATPPSLAARPSSEVKDTEATPSSLELINSDANLSSLVNVRSDEGDFTELHKHYFVYDQIDSGGFGEVHHGIHILTGEEVAIKIMEKERVSNTVWLEIDAMRNLHHQHVCQLYHVIESPNLIFLVMEYCSGGELYDLIMESKGFSEVGARRFFRQIVSAVAYIHSQGYAHRDLKPKNLLLDEHVNIKLIDFGLCAKPEGGLSSPLTGFCGTEEYIAPEIYEPKPYFGSEVDVWSLGMVLCAMLCGSVPSEVERMSEVSRKIMRGQFETTNWLSAGSIHLLKQMLHLEPKRRLTVEQLLDHEWVMKGYSSPVEWHSTRPLHHLDQDCIIETALLLSLSEQSTVQLVSEWKFDQTTATYLLLLAKKERLSAACSPSATAAQISTQSSVDQVGVQQEH